MNLNQRQQTILKVLCAYMTVTMLWPPFYFGGGGGYNPGLGYGFLLFPPEDGRVDATQLMIQWLLGVIVSGVAILQAKDWTPGDKLGFTKRIGPALKQWLGINGFVSEFVFPAQPMLANLALGV